MKKGFLQVDIKVDKNKFKDPHNLSREIERTTQQAFDRRIKISNSKQLNDVFNLVRQAYECICEPKNKIKNLNIEKGVNYHE